jgi:hypothetical protein
MKTIKQFGLMLTLFSAIIMSSCSGDDDGGSGGGSAPLGKVTAKVDGKNFSSYVATGTKQGASGAYSIIVQASDEKGNAINLMVHGVDGQPGTYEIDTENNISSVATYTETVVNLSNPAASTMTTYTAPYEDSGLVGSITFTEITDTNIKGNFQFKGKHQTGTEMKQITNGAFNLNLQ